LAEFFLQSDIDEIAERLDARQKFEGKTVLITGAGGFLGRYFIEVFEKFNQSYFNNPVKVIAVDNLITSGQIGSKIIEDVNVDFVEHDVTKKFDTKQPVDYIMHAAGIASPHYYKKYPLETLEVAITGTKNMLSLAQEKKSRFLFFSSSEIYGDPDSNNIPTSESYRGNVSCLGPRACYDESKRVGETLCYIFQHKFNVHTNIVRPFNLYGPGMQEEDLRVLPNFASKIKSKLPLKIYGDGKQTRTFCYITDAITGLLKVVLDGKKGEVYNIGNPSPEVSILDIVKSIQQVLKRDIPFDLIEYPESYPSGEPYRRCPDIQKAKDGINYIPQINLNEGLKRFLTWTNENYEGK
jgi:UDP-glucuronate decarboxylase